MLSRLALLLALGALATATVIPTHGERRLADADFLRWQKQVLELYIGVGHNVNNQYHNWNINENLGSFTDQRYPQQFWESYQTNFLPRDAIFSFSCHASVNNSIQLFDVFYFAKDLDTFVKAASWARANVNPGVFFYAYTLALYHRPDCQAFQLPPFYEVLPNFFVPVDTLHRFYDARSQGVKEYQLNYNNTGYEYSAHTNMFGGLLGSDNRAHGEYRISYLREDVGWNSWFGEWLIANPPWYCNHKYNRSPPVQRRGENFYELVQRILSRYSLERLATGLPNVDRLSWRQPIRVGYNPRVAYINGQPLYTRPDNVVPVELNEHGVNVAESYERRVWEAVDAGVLWELANNSFIRLNESNGLEILGRIIYGSIDRPSRRYYQSVFKSGVDALAHLVSTASDRQLVGGALSNWFTNLRDPVTYNYLTRLLGIFQQWQQSIGPYKQEQLVYNGVTVEDIEVDKFLTYFELFEYEVTNGIPVSQNSDYEVYRYQTRQYRLNHKPYTYNVTVRSENSGEAIVRVFLGSQWDQDGRVLSNEQSRLNYFEIDRFAVQLNAGVNTFERSSSESPFFVQDRQGLRSLYRSVNNAINQKEQLYVNEGGRCGWPVRLQLPMGWKGGREATLAVVVSPFDRTWIDTSSSPDIACGGGRLNDRRTQGFPFDRPADFSHVPNVLFRNVNIYHKEAIDINRSPTA